MKVMDKDKLVDAADKKRLQREISILRKIRHPNIIQLYEVIIHSISNSRLNSSVDFEWMFTNLCLIRSLRHLDNCFYSWNMHRMENYSIIL